MRSLVLKQSLIFPFFLFFVLFAGCEKKNTYVPPPAPVVTVQHPVKKDVVNFSENTGTTSSLKSVDIRARVEGFLDEIHFADSARVKKGELLFTIDPRSFKAQLDEATAQLSEYEAELKVAEATLKRKSNAHKKNAVSELDVIDAVAKRDKAKAAIAGARAAIEVAALQLSYTSIKAPISGRIDRHLVDEGNLVGAGGDNTLLTTIVSDIPIYAYVDINERDMLKSLERMRTDNGVGENSATLGKGSYPIYLGLSTESGYPHKGAIDYMENTVDSNTGTIKIRGIFPNTEHLLIPGLFVRVKIPTGQLKDALLVPDEALCADQTGKYLLAVNDKGVVEKKQVKTGQRFDGMRVILEGITMDDSIITNGIQKARPGSKVKIDSKDTETSEQKTGITPDNGSNGEKKV